MPVKLGLFNIYTRPSLSQVMMRVRAEEKAMAYMTRGSNGRWLKKTWLKWARPEMNMPDYHLGGIEEI